MRAQLVYAALIALALCSVTSIVIAIDAAVNHHATVAPYCPPDPRDCD